MTENIGGDIHQTDFRRGPVWHSEIFMITSGWTPAKVLC